MKKIILPILLFMMFIPAAVNAKEYCTVVSGNGKDIGSEIACGTEHFYVIESNDSEAKMLAKYNLDVGYVITIKEDITQDECTDYVKSKGYEYYGEDYSGNIWNVIEMNYTTHNNKNYCVASILLDEEVIQNSKAIGAHGSVNGEPEYPEYGVFTIKYNYGMFSNYGTAYSKNFIDAKASIYEGEDWDYPLHENLELYKNNLSSKGYSINDIDLISVKEINNIVEKISNKSLPLEQWMENVDWNGKDKPSLDGDGYYLIGDLKEYLPKGYEWIYGTTYWTRTLYYSETTNLDGEQYPYFIDTLGNLCDGYECWGMLGAGIRPVVTIEKANIKYNIKTKTDGNGTIEVVDTASGGETISFRVSAIKGLKIAGLTITTDSGETVQFNEEDLTNNEDGTISISTNKFTMPYENVTIEARWTSSIINPNTGTGISFIITILLFVSSITYIIIKKKKNYILK